MKINHLGIRGKCYKFIENCIRGKCYKFIENCIRGKCYKFIENCIRGKCYKFIENLYLSSKACVRVDEQLSKSFNIKKGVRQGLSPLTNFT